MDQTQGRSSMDRLRKQHRLYKREKKTGDPAHIQEYKEQKSLAQRESRKAYWSYIDTVISPKEEDNTYTPV